MPAQVLNAGVQYMSVQVVHAGVVPPPHWDAQCCAPHETTAPQHAAHPLLIASFVWRHDATHVVIPLQFAVR
jgi:hypothetical protein